MDDPITQLACLYFGLGGVVYLLNSEPLSAEEAEKTLTYKAMLKEFCFWPAFIWPFK